MSDVSLISLIQTGLIWATTISWAEVVRSGTNYIYPNDEKKVLEAQIIYAIILTFIVIVIFYFLQTTKNKIIELKETIDKRLVEMQKNQSQTSQFK